MAQVSDSWSPPTVGPDASVCHYTDPSGLVGILESRELWATEASGLNDMSELVHGRKVVVRLLSELAEKNPDDLAVGDLLDAASDEHAAQRELQTTYLLCASLARDDAAQWRLYGGRRAGYALHLDSSVPLRVIRRTDPPVEPSEPADPSGLVFSFAELADWTEIMPWTPVAYTPRQRRRLVDHLVEWARLRHDSYIDARDEAVAARSRVDTRGTTTTPRTSRCVTPTTSTSLRRCRSPARWSSAVASAENAKPGLS